MTQPNRSSLHGTFDQLENLDDLLASQQAPAPAPALVPDQPTDQQPADDGSPTEPAPVATPALQGVYVHSPVKPPRRGTALVVPAILVMFTAFATLGYRLSQSDWHWDFGRSAPAHSALAKAQPQPAQQQPVVSPTDGEVRKAETLVEKPATEPDARSADVEIEPRDLLARADAAPLPPQPNAPPDLAAPPSGDAATAPQPAETLTDIEQEARRLHAEREALEKHKKEAGEEMAREQRNRPPLGFPFRGIDPRFLAMRNQFMEQMMQQQLAANERQFQAMLDAQERFMRQRGFNFAAPGPNNGQADRVFQDMRREMEAFEREARAMMNRGNRPIPDAPEPGNAEDGPAGVQAAPDWPPANRPQIEEFHSIDPRTGSQIRGYRMRWSSTSNH